MVGLILRIHLSPTLRSAIDSAARASGLSLSAWIRAGLDAAAGGEKLPAGFRGASAPASAGAGAFTAATITLRATEEQARRYRLAATLAWVPNFSEWAQMVLAVAAGISDWPKQINMIGKIK